MPIYQVERNGKIYEIDAPSPKAAAAAFNPKEAGGVTDPASVRVTNPPAWYQPGGDALLDNVRAAADVVRGGGKELIQQGLRGGAKLRQIPGVNAVANALPSVPVGDMQPQNTPERLGQAALNLLEFVRGGQLVGGMTSPLAARAAAGAGINAGLAQAQGQGPVGTAVSAGVGALTPVGQAAIEAIPRSARAGQKFQDVMGAAKDVPVNIEGPGASALRIQDLAERGGSMPMAVRKFLLRVTDPEKTPLTYAEARDFYSNISRLSANETQRLTPVVAREIAQMRAALDAANESAAGAVGKATIYREAMREYRRAALGRDALKRGLKYGAGAVGAGAAYKLLGRE